MKVIGNDKSVGVFDCENVTIVNGAQTAGTVGRHKFVTESNAVLQLRIIEVDNPDSPVGKRITRASNTQNRIDARNFVALDPEQERIRTELLIDGINYEYREGESLDASTSGFEFIEAITASACASSEISYVALAKGYVGGLYVDIAASPYRALFNPSTSSKDLWNLIQIVRRADIWIKDSYDPEMPSQRGAVVHGNRFIMHCILRKLHNNGVLKRSQDIEDSEMDNAVSKTLNGVCDALDGLFPDAYLAPLFKNMKKCLELRNTIENTSTK